MNNFYNFYNLTANDLQNRKTISSTLLKFLDRQDVNLQEFLEVANQKPAPPNLLTRTYNRFLLAFVKRPKKIIIFGNGLENGLVTFLMTQCTEIGLKLSPVMFTSETRGGFIVEFNDCLFDLNALYPATREERQRNNEISLVNDDHELVPQAARRCRDASAAICVFSARKKPNEKAFPELKAICDKIPRSSKLIIATGSLNLCILFMFSCLHLITQLSVQMTFDENAQLLPIAKRVAKESNLGDRDFEIIPINCKEVAQESSAGARRKIVVYDLNSIKNLFNKLL
jgi:hypothetical protein